jgi:phenylpropionate dioxygenase-like ring-hydroxylating dioxygenase large terminal subunit
MARLDYWHPVLDGRRLPADRAVAVRVAGRSLALFRAGGRPAAVDDQCAHRRMRLSLGTVCQDRLVCPYHGWSYDRDGQGESPSAPRVQACVPSYDCAESSGVVWVRARGARQELPLLVKDGWAFAGTVFNRLRAPLQLVIDNFSEIEHTVTTHPHFGFDAAAAGSAVVDMEAAEDSVTVRGHGLAKAPPIDTRMTVGFRRGDRFHAEYTFRFDPPRSAVTHWWSDPQTGRERRLKYHVLHYFVPEDDSVTRIVTFAFLKIDWPVLWRLGPRVGWLLRRRIWQTVQEDAHLVEHLADQSTSLTGMRLSRFDAILGLTRARLRRIYDGDGRGN